MQMMQNILAGGHVQGNYSRVSPFTSFTSNEESDAAEWLNAIAGDQLPAPFEPERSRTGWRYIFI
jgi:hypothetical protein